MNDPVERIQAIRKSMWGFVCGLLGLIPLLGLLPAVYAISSWFILAARTRDCRNPAHLYLVAGAILGLLGLGLTFLLVLGLALHLTLGTL